MLDPWLVGQRVIPNRAAPVRRSVPMATTDRAAVNGSERAVREETKEIGVREKGVGHSLRCVRIPAQADLALFRQDSGTPRRAGHAAGLGAPHAPRCSTPGGHAQPRGGGREATRANGRGAPARGAGPRVAGSQ